MCITNTGAVANGHCVNCTVQLPACVHIANPRSATCSTSTGSLVDQLALSISEAFVSSALRAQKQQIEQAFTSGAYGHIHPQHITTIIQDIAAEYVQQVLTRLLTNLQQKLPLPNGANTAPIQNQASTTPGSGVSQAGFHLHGGASKVPGGLSGAVSNLQHPYGFLDIQHILAEVLKHEEAANLATAEAEEAKRKAEVAKTEAERKTHEEELAQKAKEAEEAKLRAQKAEEEAAQKAADEVRKQAETAREQADAEAKKKAEEDEKKRLEEAAASKAQEEQKNADEEAKKLVEQKAKEDSDAKKKALEAARGPLGSRAIDQQIVDLLNKIGRCPYNLAWVRVQDGFRCEGQGHSVSDAQLESSA